MKLRKVSGHGLGHLLNPLDVEDDSRDWIEELWTIIALEALGVCVERPEWLSQPAISRETVTSIKVLESLTPKTPKRRRKPPYATRMKPMNFLVTPHIAPFGHPEGADPEKFRLVAPFEPNPSKWTKMDWIEINSGKTYRITTGPGHDSRLVCVKSYADVFAEYVTHPEPKSAGADGEPCGRTTSGELARRPVHGTYPTHIGKESNDYEQVEIGAILDWFEVRSDYHDPKSDPWHSLVVPVLKMMNRKELATLSDVSERHIRRLRNGHEMPSPELQEILTRAAGSYAREKLGSGAPDDDLAACASLLKG